MRTNNDENNSSLSSFFVCRRIRWRKLTIDIGSVAVTPPHLGCLQGINTGEPVLVVVRGSLLLIF